MIPGGDFTTYERRKTQTAAAATLPPYETAIDASARFPDLIAIGNDFSRRVFDGPFYLSPSRVPTLPAVDLVFVQSRDGNTGASNPTTLGGGEVDLHVVYEGLSRVAADAVMAGAATLCGSRMVLSVWHPELVDLRAALNLPRHPAQVIVSDVSLNLDRELFANVPALRVFVVTTARGRDRMGATLEERPWITPIVMTPESGIRGALRVLAAEHGVGRVSCIGGATTAASLIDAGVVQDLYLTTAAKPGGRPGTPFYAGDRLPPRELVVRKLGTGAERGVRFEHFVFR
jgi:riboflavin biosynthesis pyrimidine reductase